MGQLITTLKVVRGGREFGLRWPAVAAAAAFATSAVGTSLLHLSRPLFVAAWTAVVTMTIIAWVMSEGWNPMVQIRRRWVSGLVVGVMAGRSRWRSP